MTADEIRVALRRKHPAKIMRNGWPSVGPFVVLEEAWCIDLLAIQATGDQHWIGYEIKVTRSDYRRELLAPSKREKNVARCHQFYFAVPKGLLTKEEIAFEEPEWEDADFERERCPGRCFKIYQAKGHHRRVPVPCVLPEAEAQRSSAWMRHGWMTAPCTICDGKGYLVKSRVERDAPTLWVPADCGLVVVDGRGGRIVRRAIVREPRQLTHREVSGLVRYISLHPDPRHAGIVERQRELGRAMREREREMYA
jgi:hypothetical protein